MTLRCILTKLILTTFVLSSLFGMYGMVSLSHGEHGTCSPMPGQHMVCVNPLEHLEHWQALYTATFAQTVALAATMMLYWIGGFALHKTVHAYKNRTGKRAPLRPTIFQELFAKGILHRKVPIAAYARVPIQK